MGLHKILKIVLGIVGVAALIIAGMVWSENDALQSGEADTGIIDTYITITMAVLALICFIVVVFVLKGLVTGNAKNTLMGVGAFAVVAAISYFSSTGEEVALKDGGVLSASGSQLVSAGITMFFILGAIAILLMLGSGLKKLVK